MYLCDSLTALRRRVHVEFTQVDRNKCGVFPLLCRLTKSIVRVFPRLGEEIPQPIFHVFFVGFPPLYVYFD